MSIVASELVWRKSAEVSDAGTNGGRMTVLAQAIASAVKNNIFPDVPQSERTAGSTKWRKVFIHVANDADLTLVAPKVFVESRTPGDDNVTFIAGTQTNTQSNIAADSNQRYGNGQLHANVTSTATSIVVDVEDAALTMFAQGMKIRISDKASINGSGNEEYAVIDTVNYVGNECTLGLTTGLVNGYSASNTKVASVYEPGDVACSVTGWTEDNGSNDGTYNEATYPLVLDNLGTIEQTWTVEFTGATSFTIHGDTLGQNFYSGNTGSDANPSNTNFSRPYFTLRSAGWNGTWGTGNTVQFTTHPAAIPLWYRRRVPAGASSLSGNSVIVAVDGESA